MLLSSNPYPENVPLWLPVYRRHKVTIQKIEIISVAKYALC